eukprot:SAG31_NODE_42880_length_269_cov_1.211765_1_plen_26_part_10
MNDYRYMTMPGQARANNRIRRRPSCS